MITEVFFDVETKSFFDESGASKPEELGVSIVSLYRRTLDEKLNEVEGKMYSFWEQEFEKMWPLFLDAKRIIGFNSIRFDVPALKPYSPSFFTKLHHFDILTEIKNVFGRRVSLDNIAKETLGTSKIDNGANAVMYFQKGDQKSLELLRKYCEADVDITKQIYDFALKNKFLKFKDHWNNPIKIDVDFSYKRESDEKQESQLGLF
jgi:DEAD/DEAH box helicase domain-containing protein